MIKNAVSLITLADLYRGYTQFRLGGPLNHSILIQLSVAEQAFRMEFFECRFISAFELFNHPFIRTSKA